MKVPCEECILMAVCRIKPFSKLIFECSLLSELLYATRPSNHILLGTRTSSFDSYIFEIEKALTPTRWRPRWYDDNRIEIIGRVPHV